MFNSNRLCPKFTTTIQVTSGQSSPPMLTLYGFEEQGKYYAVFHQRFVGLPEPFKVIRGQILKSKKEEVLELTEEVYEVLYEAIQKYVATSSNGNYSPLSFLRGWCMSKGIDTETINLT